MNERGSAGTLGSAEDRFQQVLGTLQRGMEAQQWRTWFRNMRLGSWADGQLKILLPNRFYQEWFQSKFHDRVRAAAEKHTDGPVQVLFVVEDEDGPSVNGTDGEAVAEPTPAPLFVAPESAPAPSPGWPDDLFDATPINPHYTFRDFVTGPSNEMAYASARGVADEVDDGLPQGRAGRAAGAGGCDEGAVDGAAGGGA